jgi:hypothetical protein
MDSLGNPKELDEITWTEWGGQPLFWNADGDMENNAGSAGNMIKHGTITPVEYPEEDGYTPDMMDYDGSTGYYRKTGITTSGNKVTGVLRFKIDSFTGGGFYYLCRIASNGPDRERLVIVAWSSDYADPDLAGRISVWTRNSSNALISFLHSPAGYLDGESHTLFYSFDGDAGTATYRIDQEDADDTGNADRIAPTVGTLGTGKKSQVGLGASNTGTKFVDGELGFFGHREAYLTNYIDFMDSLGNPKELDETTWTEWGAQPLFWNADGDMELNAGSAGNMTKHGTITPVEY